MMDDIETINKNTWTRAVDVVNKIGYMDGASDGQNVTYQSSFDSGYKLGINFGLQLGYKEALISLQASKTSRSPPVLSDSRRINCQACLDNALLQNTNVDNISNMQEEKNDLHIQELTNHLIVNRPN